MLPKIDLPTYEVKLPSNEKVLTIRPFLVKEEKLLLMALESGDDNYIINTTKQIISNCVLTEGFNVDKIPFFDVDYLFIALRAKSVGENIEVKFTCNNQVNGIKCGNIFPAKIDITNCRIVKNETVLNKIQLGPQTMVQMKYPNYTTMKILSSDENIMERKIKVMASCIEQIVDKDSVYSSKDFTREEAVQFVENLKQEQFKKLELFVDNFPSFLVTTDASCNKCGFVHKIEYGDFASFFV